MSKFKKQLAEVGANILSNLWNSTFPLLDEKYNCPKCNSQQYEYFADIKTGKETLECRNCKNKYSIK